MAKLPHGRSGSNDATGGDLDAKAISFTRRKRGRWNVEKRRGEEAHCFVCDKPTMVLTPKGDGGVLAHCEAKGCQARKWPMYRAAKADGYDLSAPRSVTRKIADRERAEREAEDAWNGLSRRGKAVTAALAHLLEHDARRSLPLELDALAAEAGLPKRTAQRGIDDAEAAGLIERRTKAGSQGFRKGPVNRYAIASVGIATVIRTHSVKVAIRDVLLGSKLTTGGTESRRFAGVGESTSISERDMPYESASPVGATMADIGAVDASLGHWRNGGLKTGATVATAGAQAEIASTLRGSQRSHRGGLLEGIHPSDHLNQASAPPTSDSGALPPEADIAAHCIPAHAHAHASAHTSAHTRTRETPPALEECSYACRDGCIAPLRHKRNPITGALGSGDEQWIRGEKSAHRGDTPDNGKDRAKWAKSSS